MRIKLTTLHPEWPLVRQTPGGLGIWREARFVIDRPAEGADWWFVYDDLPAPETVDCRVGKTVLVTPEPPALKQYNPEFAAQFDYVITADRNLRHPRKIYSHQGQPWHVGRRQAAGKNIEFTKSYDELKSLWPIPKSKLISVIASDKTHTPGHKLRFNFVKKLAEHFGDRIEIFGWGSREISDKWDGIAPFRYHVTLENCSIEDYWTEKLSDAFLAGAFPIYHGCRNILDYFPRESLALVDISNPTDSIDRIEQLIGSDTFERSTDEILKARQLVLDSRNLFNLLGDFASKHEGEGNLDQKALLPSSAFAIKPSLGNRFFGKIHRLLRQK